MSAIQPHGVSSSDDVGSTATVSAGLVSVVVGAASVLDSSGLHSSWSESRVPPAPSQRRARGRPGARRRRPPPTHRRCRWGPWSSSQARSGPCRSLPVVRLAASVVVASVVGAVSVVTVSITVVVAGCVVVVGSVTVVGDTDVVAGDVSVGLGSVGRVSDPVGRVKLVSGGSPEPSPPQPPRR